MVMAIYPDYSYQLMNSSLTQAVEQQRYIERKFLDYQRYKQSSPVLNYALPQESKEIEFNNNLLLLEDV